MSLLTIVQQHCLVNGLASPSIVATAVDAQTKQILAILNMWLDEVLAESKFTGYDMEGTWVTLAAQDQGVITTVFGADLYGTQLNNMTLFNRTLNTPILGPLTDYEWQALKAATALGPYSSYRIRNNHLYMYPAPAAGQTLGFEYKSTYGVLSGASVRKRYFTADDDTAVLDEGLAKHALSYLWKRQKGVPYQADEASYYKLLNQFIAGDGSKRKYNLSDSRQMDRPLYPNPWIPAVAS